MPSVAVSIDFNGLPLVDPVALFDECQRLNIPTGWWFGRPNSFVLPRGWFPGEGWILLTKKNLDKVDFSKADHKLTFCEGANKITIQNLIVMHADAIASPGVALDETVYLVHLADIRIIGPISGSSTPEQFNVLSYEGLTGDYYEETRNPSTGVNWTWQEMLDDLWTSLSGGNKRFGDNPQLPDTNFFPTADPEDFSFTGTSVWDAINHILAYIDHTTVPDPTKDTVTFSYLSLGKEQTELQPTIDAARRNGKLLDTSLSINGTLHTVPGTLATFFPKRGYAYQQSANADILSAQDRWRALDHIAVKIDGASGNLASADTKTLAGTVFSIWDSLEALIDDTGALFNNAALDTRANDIANHFFKAAERTDKNNHQIFSGLLMRSDNSTLPLLPGSELSTVAWYDIGDVNTDGSRGGIKTEIVLRPRLSLFSPETSGTRLRNSYIVKPNPFIIGVTDRPRPPIFAPPTIHHTRYAWVELTQDLKIDNKATAKLLFGDVNGTITWTDVTLGGTRTLTIHNFTRRHWPIGSRVFAIWNFQAQQWVIVAGYPPTHIFRGLNTANQTFGATPITIDFDDVDRQTSTATEVSVFNTTATAGEFEFQTFVASTLILVKVPIIYDSAPTVDNRGRIFLELDTGAGFSAVANTESVFHLPNDSDARDTPVITHMLYNIAVADEFDAGDKIRVRAERTAGSNTLRVVSNTGGAPDGAELIMFPPFPWTLQ